MFLRTFQLLCRSRTVLQSGPAMRLAFPKGRDMKPALFTLCSFFLGAYLSAVFTKQPVIRTIDPLTASIDFRREMADELEQLARDLAGAWKETDPQLMSRLGFIIARLDPRRALSFSEPSNATATDDTEEVCGEEYTGGSHSYPFYQENFHVSPSCDVTAKPPFHHLVTVLLHFADSSSSRDLLPRLQAILSGISSYRGGLPVVLALSPPVPEPVSWLLSRHGNVTVRLVPTGSPAGRVWNLLVAGAGTPYVLLGRDLAHFSGFARLERLVHALASASSTVRVAGGAFRNGTGHWRVGCYQASVSNYHLRYEEGYHHSWQDCMLCDAVAGPFVARTDHLRRLPLGEGFNSLTVFEHWFLHMRQLGVTAVACPDSMFFTAGEDAVASPASAESHRSAWLSLARQWELQYVTLPSGQEYAFSCEEAKLSCNAFTVTQAYLLPPCCLSKVRQVFAALDEFATKHKLKYELDSGSVLGAVKVRGFMPWDIDGDVIFQGDGYATFYKYRKEILEQGIPMESFSLTYNGPAGFFKFFASSIFIEMWGVKRLSWYLLPDTLKDIPTRVDVMGLWMLAPANPGLYARNKYGPNFLKHAHSWRYLGMDSSFSAYKMVGTWRQCPLKHHHACLDLFPPDGNLAYYIPLT
ncbi:uncharacterized protein LOC134546287 isoform X2 [Bacillus rossius redtenbacheri]|uniref:uncharacterized protein LOC134546287 isoform X2 n=1 Tax=Bacillus rossius redtenbacheri TaxID=93214 RepID=UPI002FDEC0ED